MLPTNLRYFLQVAKTGSVNGASERLHVASSAISRQISSLEAKLNVQLFERCSTGMVLTSAGQKLADYAHRAILDADEVIGELNDMRPDYHGRIRVAVSDGLANVLLSEAVYLYRQQYAAVEFEAIV
ncbi:LysR family transcriptional regulator, partial [Paraburkholderia aspalathi]|nr:LysR family transcriptional regulator [Paraburkholderia aspalathi]